jgi:hypothetical protein
MTAAILCILHKYSYQLALVVWWPVLLYLWHIGPGDKRLYPSGELAWYTNGAFLSAHPPAHSPHPKEHPLSCAPGFHRPPSVF